ncbi:MAG: valine--tRNA ligase [DPANN group archaeon]|nr:valine--tRNA ligase [DPANN group archaeon]
MREIPNKYEWQDAENRINDKWNKKEIYKFDINSKKIYSIDSPPPTMSGNMHMGHAFSFSQMDFIARYKRMRGFSVFFPFGTDDNGLPTAKLVEKMKNVKSSKMERGDFVKLCHSTINELRDAFIQGWKNIGISADWSLSYSTIDLHSQKISQKSFIDLYKMGREYRMEAPYIWCPTCQTAIAQIELQDKELDSSFNDLAFTLKDGKDAIISTTRPELLPACVALFAHPDDKRYKKLEGTTAKVPIFGHDVTVLLDERVDPEKGTGLVMCCTFGDQTDIEWFKAHKLPLRVAITKDGKMTKIAGKYEGMQIKEARKIIIEDLEKAGILKSSKKITHSVNVHERCDTEIEILKTSQWFIKYLDLKKEFIDAGKKINWYPEYMRTRYDNWINGLQWDWCISMQRSFGIPFPVWYCKKCGEINVADESQLPVDPLTDKPKNKCKCGSSDFEPDRDVMNTWATSTLTPQIAIGLIDDKDAMKKLFPMDLRTQAHDIITLWLFNTVVKSMFHENNIPWKNTMISGFALDSHGKKMSKSKGNVIEPSTVLQKYPADALRFWASESKLGDDMSYQEKDIKTGLKFVTKMWNASKFAFIHLEDYKPKKIKVTNTIDKWILSKMTDTIKTCTEAFDEYQYSKSKRAFENFFWQDLCDNYLEIAKDRLYNPDKYPKGSKESAHYTLYKVLLACVKLIAPITPYISEEIYQIFFKENEKSESVHITAWPEIEKDLIDKTSEKSGDIACSIIGAVRKYKSIQNVSMNQPIKKIRISCSDELKDLIDTVSEDIQNTVKAETLEFKDDCDIECNGYDIKLGFDM